MRDIMCECLIRKNITLVPVLNLPNLATQYHVMHRLVLCPCFARPGESLLHWEEMAAVAPSVVSGAPLVDGILGGTWVLWRYIFMKHTKFKTYHHYGELPKHGFLTPPCWRALVGPNFQKPMDVTLRVLVYILYKSLLCSVCILHTCI